MKTPSSLSGFCFLVWLTALALPNVALAQKKPPAPTEVERLTGHQQQTPAKQLQFTLPAGVKLEDGLSEDEAVAIALWNNAALHADLAVLGLARADLIEAGLLRNPLLSVLLPLGPYRQFESALTFPFEVFWQRRKRVAAATAEVQRVATGLEQNALDLMRDVRLAYHDWRLAQVRARQAAEAFRIRAQIVRLTNVRLRVGDVSELEATAAQLEENLAAEQTARLNREIALAQVRLRQTMGMTDETVFTPADNPGEPIPAAFQTNAATVPEELLNTAHAARPDLRAAALAIEAAAKRAHWEHSRLATLAGLLNIKQGEGLGFSPRPGFTVEPPIFNRNQGGIARADAEVERAAWQYLAVRQRITLEVQEAFQRYQQARTALTLWHAQTLPLAEENARLAEHSFQRGDQSYLFVLDAMRRVTDVRLREIDLQADLRRALVQLDRSIGQNLRKQTNATP